MRKLLLLPLMTLLLAFCTGIYFGCGGEGASPESADVSPNRGNEAVPAESAAQRKNDLSAEEQESGEVSAEEVKKKTREAYEAARAYTLQHKKEYEKELEAKLDELNRQIDELRAEAEEQKPKVEAKLDEEIKQLEAKKEVAQNKLDELKSSSAEALDNLKRELDTAIADFEAFVKDLFPESESESEPESKSK